MCSSMRVAATMAWTSVQGSGNGWWTQTREVLVFSIERVRDELIGFGDELTE